MSRNNMWRFRFLVTIISFCWIPWIINGTTNETDVAVLNNMYSSLSSPSQLVGWSSNPSDPCGQSWKGITCSGSSVTEIKLSGLGISGSIGFQLDKMSSLTSLDLSNNNLANSIPYQLPPNLQYLDLSGNTFSGTVPYSISYMVSLRYINLSRNQLNGPLNEMFQKLQSLNTIDFSFNALTGNLPENFKDLLAVKTMYLQNNQFSGSINVLANLPLETLNVANNHFNGWIPNELKKIKSLTTDGNSWNSGSAPPPPPYTSPPSGTKTNPENNGSEGGKSGISGGGIAGIVISLLIVGIVVAFFLVKWKRKSSMNEDKLGHVQPFAPLSGNKAEETGIFQSSDFPMKEVHTSVAFESESNSVINLKPPPIERYKSFDEEDFSVKINVREAIPIPLNVTVYSIADLQIITGSFSRDNLVGEGTIGRVYRAQFSDGKVLAVKKLDTSVIPSQQSEDFLELLSKISQFHHPNITELVGYCCEHGQHLLVYEFHRNGSLHDFFHHMEYKSLTWSSRISIALGTARALEYLHEICSPSIVLKNFNSANILLDLDLNPHISDCGLATFIPFAEQQASNHYKNSGYIAPEVTMSGQYTMKSDVYSFGVVMLELLTGRKPFDSSRTRSEQFLVRWATPQLHDIDALAEMVDPELKGQYSPKSLSRFADVIALCVQGEPEFRPLMSEVVVSIVRLLQRDNMSKRTTAEQGRAHTGNDAGNIQD